MALERIRSLGQRFGSYAIGLVERFRSAGVAAAEAWRTFERVEPRVTPSAVVDAYTAAQRRDQLAPSFGTLTPGELIPRSWYQTSEIPWKRPFAYTVQAYGRDLTTGEYKLQKFDVTTAEELTVGEVEAEAEARLGLTGMSPVFEFLSLQVVAAHRRSEVSFVV